MAGNYELGCCLGESEMITMPGSRLFMKNGQLVEGMGLDYMTGPLGSTLGLAGMLGGAYHGYKRTNSVAWALGWGLAGGMFPLITGVIAYAQGFGKRK
jgi:hypothetical protein